MVDIYKVVEDNVTDKWFKAKFIGEKSYLKGLTVVTGREYHIKFMGKFGDKGWLWFVIRDPNTNAVYKLMLGYKEAQCPYRSARFYPIGRLPNGLNDIQRYTYSYDN